MKRRKFCLLFLVFCLLMPGFRAARADEADTAAAKDRALKALLRRMNEPYPGLYGSAPSLLRSYDTDNIVIRNTAFTYDNALAAMAFLSDGDGESAARILDAFVYAVSHDRYRPGRIRNAYAARTADTPFGRNAGEDLPGWYSAEAKSWLEDRAQVGSNPGNTAYAALALMQYDRLYGNEAYAAAARTLMDWVLEECSDGGDGFTAGYDGWPESSAVYPFTHKSIEHNIDAYAAFRRLYTVTGEEKYREAADSALRFIRSMYDPEAAYFYLGTLDDGITPDKGLVVLDAIVWARLALGGEFEPYMDTMDTLAGMRAPDGGYPFSKGNGDGGWWPEGTAFTALMERLYGEEEMAREALDALCSVQLESGLFPAATVPELKTGIELFDGSPWVYTDDPHIAPAAWFVLAVNGFDPYTFGD